jgi:Holliday junction DNA helicase RuvA
MISQLKGNISYVGFGYVILDVSGVGYKVYVTADALADLQKNKNEVLVWTYLAVRENSLDLYGFRSEEEMSFFDLLLDVSGIGPKSALAILNVTTVENLRKAIQTGDTSYLTKVSGVGKKSADKIVIELQDKLGKIDDSGGPQLREETDVVEALKSLGYSMPEIREAVKKIPAEVEGTSERVREALKIVGEN